MNLNSLMTKESEWLKGKGPKSNIVISSRVRLARNLENHPFFNRSSVEEKKKVIDEIKKGVEKSKFLKTSIFIHMSDISELDRQFLVERHLMSPEHMLAPENKALVFDENEIVSIMINEEDHLRIQVLQSGFNLMEAWRVIDEIDSEISSTMPYAFSSRWGYLTACPTNTGTGLRGSVMLHLPALAVTNQIRNVYQAISKLGLTMRGLYGEGTEAVGDFYQISNQVTLGHSETDLLDNIERIINKIIMRESSTRAMLMSKNKEELKDRVYRALGTLKSARIITSNETITLLSVIRLGVDVGIIKNIMMKDINELFIVTQPAHLQKLEGKVLSHSERDAKRAVIVREKLKS